MNKKINQRFAPITEELGYDDRFINKLTDFQKLVYLLIIFTCHMTHHKAPANPIFYKKRFNLNAPNSAIVKAIERILELYPKVSVKLDGSKEPLRMGLESSKDAFRIGLEQSKVFLSMLNSKTYKIGVLTETEAEAEKEIERAHKKRVPKDNPYFWEFKKLYPRCLDFKRTKGVFNKLNPDEALWGVMRKAIEEQKRSKQWQDAQYIPASFTWLEGERWKDTITVKKVESPF